MTQTDENERIYNWYKDKIIEDEREERGRDTELIFADWLEEVGYPFQAEGFRMLVEYGKKPYSFTPRLDTITNPPTLKDQPTYYAWELYSGIPDNLKQHPKSNVLSLSPGRWWWWLWSDYFQAMWGVVLQYEKDRSDFPEADPRGFLNP